MTTVLPPLRPTYRHISRIVRTRCSRCGAYAHLGTASGTRWCVKHWPATRTRRDGTARLHSRYVVVERCGVRAVRVSVVCQVDCECGRMESTDSAYVDDRRCSMKCTIDECQNEVRVSETGRPAKFCSKACKQKDYRLKQKSVTKLNNVSVTKLPDILFYCGLNEKYWNHHSVEPGKYVCIAPVTISTEEDKRNTSIDEEVKKRKVLRKTQVLINDTKIKHVLLDSGAFSDGIELKDGHVVENKRLSFENALKRQIAHAYDFRYDHLVEGIVSYDLLIDETWEDGERSKQRWSVEAAEFAVNETIQAARYLASQRKRINHAFGHPVNLILSAQGVNAEQYRRCTEEIVKLMKPDDVFGLGGWCITGLYRHKMLPAAADMLPGTFEVLGQAGVKRVHVFGVIIPKLLGFLLYLCDQYGIELSTDSAGPCVEPARNARWGYGSWTNPAYKSPPTFASCRVLDEQGNKAPTCTPETQCKGLDRVRHVQLTRQWLANFRTREADLIASIPTPEYKQMFLLEEIA